MTNEPRKVVIYEPDLHRFIAKILECENYQVDIFETRDDGICMVLYGKAYDVWKRATDAPTGPPR